MNLKILSVIINDLDISDLVETNGSGDAIGAKIRGFYIVRAPLDAQIVSEGILTPVLSKLSDSGYRRSTMSWPKSESAYDNRIKRLFKILPFIIYSPNTCFQNSNDNPKRTSRGAR